MSSVPEAMFFACEFDPLAMGTSTATATATTPAVAPSLTAQLAAASAGTSSEVPILPVAMPDQVNLLIRGPDGTVEVAVAREQQDVSVRVEVPTGLLAAVREAEAPIQVALEREGFQLDNFDVHAGEPGVDQAPERDHPREQGDRRSRGQGDTASKDSSDRRQAQPRQRLLDRRA